MKDYRTGNRKGNQHGSKNRVITKRRKTLYNRPFKRGISDSEPVCAGGNKNGVTAILTALSQGAAVPAGETLVLTAGAELRAEYFLQRREMGIITSAVQVSLWQTARI